MLAYSITPLPHSHTYKVELCFEATSHSHQLAIANWTPGSYTIRDYAGKIHSLSSNRGRLEQVNKNHWVLSNLTIGKEVRLTWLVHAYSLKVHDAYIDHQYGFINMPAICLFLEDIDDPISVRFNSDDFGIYCSLEPGQTPNTWLAKDLETFLDSPATLVAQSCPSEYLSFVVNGIEHGIIVTGTSRLDSDRLLHDISKICSYVHQFWGGIPFTNYLFHLHLGENLYGGLEHHNSCALQKTITALPGRYESNTPKGYLDVLQLFAHEYFHAWLVKFLRPETLHTYRLADNEVNTETLWVFEGFTTYYEQLIPLRAKLIDEETFFESLSERFNAVLSKEGFHHDSLSQASFNAWTHLYKPSPLSPYQHTSYYGKGALLALIVDCHIREISHNHHSLDTLLSSWFLQAARDPSLRILPEYGLGKLFSQLGFLDISSLLLALTRQQDAVLWQQMWERSLSLLGLSTRPSRKQSPVSAHLGLTFVAGPSEAFPIVAYAHTEGNAYQAGLYAGDEIISIEHNRVKNTSIERQILQWIGMDITIHFFRHGQLNKTSLNVTTETPFEILEITPYQLTECGVSWLEGSDKES